METGDWIMLGLGALVFAVLGVFAWYQKQEKIVVNGKNRLKSKS